MKRRKNLICCMNCQTIVREDQAFLLNVTDMIKCELKASCVKNYATGIYVCQTCKFFLHKGAKDD